MQCEYLTVWPQQGQYACNEAADHQVVKKGRGASYESPPPAIPPRYPRNVPPPGFEPRTSGNNSTTNNAIKEDKSSTNQANGRSLQRQGAINFDSSYPPGLEPRTAGLGLDHQQSVESTTSNQSHIQVIFCQNISN